MGQKRTSKARPAMSALCQDATNCTAANLGLFDHVFEKGEKKYAVY
jgi:hypothetical protein